MAPEPAGRRAAFRSDRLAVTVRRPRAPASRKLAPHNRKPSFAWHYLPCSCLLGTLNWHRKGPKLDPPGPLSTSQPPPSQRRELWDGCHSVSCMHAQPDAAGVDRERTRSGPGAPYGSFSLMQHAANVFTCRCGYMLICLYAASRFLPFCLYNYLSICRCLCGTISCILHSVLCRYTHTGVSCENIL